MISSLEKMTQEIKKKKKKKFKKFIFKSYYIESIEPI